MYLPNGYTYNLYNLYHYIEMSSYDYYVSKIMRSARERADFLIESHVSEPSFGLDSTRLLFVCVVTLQ